MTDYQVMGALLKGINGKEITVKRAFSEGEALSPLSLDDNGRFENLPFWVYYNRERHLIGREEIKRGLKVYVARRHTHNDMDLRILWQSIIHASR